MKYQKLSNHSQNKVNPFLPATIHHIEKGEKTLLFSDKRPDLIVDHDGTVKGHTLFARKQVVDKAEFRKIFRTSLANWFDLSKAGIRVFAYIAENLEKDKDSFEFDLETCKAFTKYSATNTILSGLSELITNQFIARGNHPYKYFINPTVFFNGNRLTLVEQYEVIDTKSLDLQSDFSLEEIPHNETLPGDSQNEQ